MPYYKRIGGSHRRRENGKMVVYRPGEILWAEEWELEHFRKVFEPVTLEAGRAAMVKRGLDPEEVEGRVSTKPPPPPEFEPEVEEIIEEEAESPPQIGLDLRDRGGGWFDVVNLATGKAINDKSLRRADAEMLLVSHAGVSHEAEEAETTTTT
jgi:hypothetical protein